MTADSSARECEVPPIVSASDRDPFASDLGSSTFVSRALSPRISFPGLRRAYSRAHAFGVVRRRRARRPQTGRILRRCLGSTRCWRRSLWCCCCSAEMSRSYCTLRGTAEVNHAGLFRNEPERDMRHILVDYCCIQQLSPSGGREIISRTVGNQISEMVRLMRTDKKNLLVKCQK